MNEKNSQWDCADPCAILIKGMIEYDWVLGADAMKTLGEHGWLDRRGQPDTAMAIRHFARLSEAVLAEVDAKDDNHVLHPLFVSVYSRHRYYGGPEEGGWYGTDVTLISHHRVADRDSAERLKRALEGSTKIEDKAERLKWARKMAQELDDAELRLGAHWEEGLLPEPDLPFTYLVYIETGLGSHASRGPRHYE